jgi:hypothetical protein
MMNWKRAAKNYRQVVKDPVKIVRLNIENGMINGTFSQFGVRVLAASFADFFRESKGINYVETRVISPHCDLPILVTLQKLGGKSPAEVASEWRGLAMELARHINNTEDESALTWGRKGLDLLVRVREKDPDLYDQEVKR